MPDFLSILKDNNCELFLLQEFLPSLQKRFMYQHVRYSHVAVSILIELMV